MMREAAKRHARSRADTRQTLMSLFFFRFFTLIIFFTFDFVMPLALLMAPPLPSSFCVLFYYDAVAYFYIRYAQKRLRCVTYYAAAMPYDARRFDDVTDDTTPQHCYDEIIFEARLRSLLIYAMPFTRLCRHDARH